MREIVEFFGTLPNASSLLTRENDFHWSKIFQWSRGQCFKLVTPMQAIRSDDAWIKEFTRVYGTSVMMPLAILDKGLGFGARSIKEKRFSTTLFQSPGFYSAQTCFENDFTYGTPVILTEGVLDAEVASLAYPWVFSMLTSKISEAQAFLLSGLTRTVVVSFDNDEAGDKGTRFGMRNLRKWGIKALDIRPSKGLKDWGDLLSLDMASMRSELNRFYMTLRTKGVM